MKAAKMIRRLKARTLVTLWCPIEDVIMIGFNRDNKPMWLIDGDRARPRADNFFQMVEVLRRRRRKYPVHTVPLR